MSVQNNLKKPAFTKTVMGYTVSEVDKYIEHITERYNSVCAENSELKRRVLRLQLKLDETNDKLGDAETAVSDPKPLDRSVLYEVFDVLDAELRRTEAFYSELKAKLNAISESKNEYSDDSEWEATLSAFIESVGAEEADTDEDDTETSDDAIAFEPIKDAEESEQKVSGIFADFESFVMSDDEEPEEEAAEEAVEAPVSEETKYITSPADEFSADEELLTADEDDEETVIMNSDEGDASYEEETEMLLKLLQGTFNVTSEEEKPFEHDLGAEFAGDDDAEEEYEDLPDWHGGKDTEPSDNDTNLEEISDESTEKSDADSEAREKTPAEIAAELDFYTDSVHRDGESFDPMTLARQATERKPKYEDFFHTEYKNKK